jgi:hypothetical protein
MFGTLLVFPTPQEYISSLGHSSVKENRKHISGMGEYNTRYEVILHTEWGEARSNPNPKLCHHMSVHLVSSIILRCVDIVLAPIHEIQVRTRLHLISNRRTRNQEKRKLT